MKLSIVVPVYNEEDVIQEFIKRVQSLINNYINRYNFKESDIEILFINDGSTDNSFNILRSICQTRPNYRLINLSRNYGHQVAITAGLENSRGEAVAIVDADLQDPPEFIINLYDKFLEGYDVVNAVREKRKGESFFKIITARIFYRFLKKLTNVDIPVDTGDFRIISRRVAEALSRMPERHRYIRGMVSWVGFKQISIAYVRDERVAGKTKFPLGKMLKFAIDGITSFSSIPLRLSSYLGFFTAFLGFLYSLDVLYVKFFTTRTVPGWTSIVMVVLLLGGVQLICLGMIGEYLSRMSDEGKNRPLYLIEGIYDQAADRRAEDR
jgi:dolichol-phosphate mannosyltransferase